MSVANIITQLAAIEGAILGIKKAWDKAPESLSELPCFVNFPVSGEYIRDPMRRVVRHTIRAQLYVVRSDLLSAEATLRPFLEQVMDALDADLDLGASCDYHRITRYEYGALMYGGVGYLGMSFDLEVSEFTSKVFMK